MQTNLHPVKTTTMKPSTTYIFIAHLVVLTTQSACVSTLTLIPKDSNNVLGNSLIEVKRVKTEGNTLYQTRFNFKGEILTSDGKAYANKEVLVSSPVADRFETDSMGHFDKVFVTTSASSHEAYDKGLDFSLHIKLNNPEWLPNRTESTCAYEFCKTAINPTLLDGTTVNLIIPLEIEMTIERQGKYLIVRNRKELVPHIQRYEDSATRDILITDWVETAATKPLRLSPTYFHSEKNKQITEAERIEKANRIQKKREQDEIRNREASLYQARMEKERTIRCAKQQDLIGNRHLCSEIIPQFIAGQDTPNTDCIYLHKSEMYNPFVKVLSIANEGCVYYFDNYLDMIYNPEPIFVYKTGDPETDNEAMNRVYPALRWMYVTATCGDVDLPLPIGYYAYSGQYSYVALRGNSKRVYSFKRLDIDSECLD